MTKPRTPNQKKCYTALNKRLAKYVSLVQSVYDQLGMEAANIVATATNYAGEKPFRFKDYPQTKARVDNLMRFFSRDIQTLIYSGTTEEWKQSNLVQDLLANDVLKAYGIKRDGKKYKQYYQPNNDALKAFQRRKDKGFTVSQKIWNQSYNFKREMEYAISSAIEKGQSAVTLSKRISKYLHDFPSLQADYKERFGTATGCHDCEYRSIRLARSEINMAYREAEQTRWQQMDFIKGYEIKLSGSHPKHDICDELAGVYPKWFKWTGWHPKDLCYVVPIVMTDDEWYSGKGKEIVDTPDNFKEWIGENQNRIAGASDRGTLPYWIADNKAHIMEKLYEYNITHNDSNGIYEDIARKVKNILKPAEGKFYVSFEPFSPIVMEKLNSLRSVKRKMGLFNEILNDERAEEILSSNTARTIMFPNHKGKGKSSWEAVKRASQHLNNHGKSVILLPELNGTTHEEISADALTLFKGKPVIADFKCPTEYNWNSLQKSLKHGFEQAGTVLLYPDEVKIDGGLIKESIEYLRRNKKIVGNLAIINEYGEILELDAKEIRFGSYKKKLKGFL